MVEALTTISDKYLLLRTLGSGSFGKVKLAQNRETQEQVAIKILLDAGNNTDMFLEEVRTMAKLNHPNVLRLIEFNESGVKKKKNGDEMPVTYGVIELASGGEIFDFIAETGKFSEPVCRYFFRQIIDGLDAVHKEGVSHRDLKPENILLDSDFNIKIADFGWAANLEGRDGEGWLRT